MALTDTAIKNAKPLSKPLRLSDERGLYLLLNPDSSRWWRLDYRFEGKRKTLSMGVYPDVSLKLAREKREEARSLIAVSVDPGVQRKSVKKAKAEAGANTFEALAYEWMDSRGKDWTESYASKTKSALVRHAFPVIGRKPITEITAPEVLAMLRVVENRGIVDMAHRIQQHCGAIFRFAIATGRATNDPVPSLKGALSTVKQEHYPAITDPVEFAQLLRDIDSYRGEATNPSEVRKQNRQRVKANIKRPALQFSLTESGGMLIENKSGKMLLNAEQVIALRAFLDAARELSPCL